MDIYSLKEDGAVLCQIGYTLQLSQRLKLELALLRLSQVANADQLLFWGKVLTQGAPYYIAVAIDFKGHYSFPHKRFYYASADWLFTQLVVGGTPHADAFNGTPFTGLPSTILIAQEPHTTAPQDSDQPPLEVVPVPYKEDNRLAQVVRAIENDCQLVPISAFRINVAHQLRYNQDYQGEDLKEKSFIHFRYPLQKDTIRCLESPQAIFKFDFLDPIENRKMWSFQQNQSLITARSFQWVGYIAFAAANKKKFGGVYYGNGNKNVDVQFYL